MKYGILIVTFIVLASCGSRSKSGACKDYEPMDMCGEGSVYECIDTDDGCRQCGCVTVKGHEERIGYGD